MVAQGDCACGSILHIESSPHAHTNKYTRMIATTHIHAHTCTPPTHHTLTPGRASATTLSCCTPRQRGLAACQPCSRRMTSWTGVWRRGRCRCVCVCVCVPFAARADAQRGGIATVWVYAANPTPSTSCSFPRVRASPTPGVIVALCLERQGRPRRAPHSAHPPKPACLQLYLAHLAGRLLELSREERAAHLITQALRQRVWERKCGECWVLGVSREGRAAHLTPLHHACVGARVGAQA